MEQLTTNVFWHLKGKSEKLVLEPLNFADDIVQSGNRRKRAVFKKMSGALFINLD